MDHKSVKKIIEDFELSIDVNSITYNGFSIWPILKNYIIWRLYKYDTLESSANSKQKTSNFKNQGLKINIIFGPIYELITGPIKFKLSFFKYKVGVEATDVLCIDVADKLYEDEIAGKKCSRYFSPYLDFLKRRNSVLLLNTINEFNKNIDKVVSPYYFNINNYIKFHKVVNRVKYKFGVKRQQIQNLNYCIQYFESISLNKLVSENYLNAEFDEISIYESFWMTFLKAKKPKLIYLSCHYGNRSHYGMLSAAKQLNIKTIEIQHGIALSEIYLGYYNTPIGGYNYLPDYYWCWSKFDAENILRSRNKSTEFLPVVGGNLWLGKSINENLLNEYDFELEKIVKERSPKKIIFVTLQHSIPVSESLIDAIRSSDEDCFWLIRFHPRDYVDPEYRKKYVAAFSNLKNVEYVNATKASLYNILKFVNVHITHHSNVAVEAISFNVPTILLGDKFKDIYKDYIDAGVFFIANSSKEIERLLDTIIELDSELMERFKMQYEESVALNAFNEISIS